MDFNKCILCQSDSKNLLNSSKTVNPRVCGYTLLANKIAKFIEEGIVRPKKMTVGLNYLRSEGTIALTLKQNCVQWHNCALLKLHHLDLKEL